MSRPDPRERLLAQLEQIVRADPESIPARLQYASFLESMGRFDDAKNAYIAVLQHDITNLGALNNLGNLLYEAGFKTAARTTYVEAIKHHPDSAMAHFNVGNAYLDYGDYQIAKAELERALELDPALQGVHQSLGNVFEKLGDDVAADRHRRLAFAGNSISVSPYRGAAKPVDVLVLAAAGRGNIPVSELLPDQVFRTTRLIADYHDRTTPLPHHDVVLNVIGDADACGAALQAAIALLPQLRAPVINDPRNVLCTSRVENARVLGDLEDVVAPKVLVLSREDCLRTQGFAFPLLIRSPGYHTGQHFVKVEDAAAIPAAIADLPGDELAVMEFLDARGSDGKARKYRVMFVDGRIYPMHLAISENWKVHYYTSEMADTARYREEEAVFLENMESVLGTRALTALERIQAAMGLDYGGADFALDGSGRVLLFEANATMIVTRPPNELRWAYRQGPTGRIIGAARDMVSRRAAGT